MAQDPAVARALGLPYPTLEGFLFPDTYSFARGVSRPHHRRGDGGAVQGGVRAAPTRLRKPGVGLDLGEAATLASIVEKETGRPEERPRIACVFHNRLAARDAARRRTRR